MENELVNNEDQVYIKEVNGIKGIHYKINYNDQNIFKDTRFNNWLNEEIIKKGKDNILYQCPKCDFFLYGKYDEIKSFPHCDKYFNMDYICLYCGKKYLRDSLCCSKRGLKYFFFYYFFKTYWRNQFFYYIIKFIPFLFNIVFIGNIFFGLFFFRKLKVEDDKFSNYITKRTLLSNFTLIIALLFTLVYSILYFFVFIIIYLIFLILYFIDN